MSLPRVPSPAVILIVLFAVVLAALAQSKGLVEAAQGTVRSLPEWRSEYLHLRR